jgi:hypothetical protein
MGEGQGEGKPETLNPKQIQISKIPIIFSFWLMAFGLRYINHPDAQYDEYHRQTDGELEQALLHAPPRPVDAFRLSEDTSQSAASHLHGNHRNQGDGHDNLGNQ